MKFFIVALLTALFLIGFSFANEQRGQAIYVQACQVCHNSSTAPLMNSPTAHDVKAWKERLEAAEELAKKEPSKYASEYKGGMVVLIQTVKKGKGAMIPGGMCQDAATPDKKCTDADYAAAIQFMMSPEK